MADLNYFAEGEQASQARFRDLRDRLLNPIARACIACGLSADAMSLLALAMLIPFGWMLLAEPFSLAILISPLFLWLHVALDGLDGPVARLTGTAGPAGAFTDMIVDHSGYLIVTCLLVAAGKIDGTWACAYVASYTMSVVLIVALNTLGRPMRFVVRTKYLFYGLYTLLAVGDVNMLTPAAIVFSAVHTLYAIKGVIDVRRALREKRSVDDE